MNKIKISELEFKDNKTFHNGIEVDLSTDYANDLIDFENDNLYYVQLKKEEYDHLANVNDLNQMMWVKIISSLLRADVIEDVTNIHECKDYFFFDNHDTIREMIGLKIEHYNPYKLKYDTDNLKLEEDGSYTLNGIVCIEPNHRTSNYFRDFLMLYNSDKNVLSIGYGDNPVMEQFGEHQHLQLDYENRYNDQLAIDELDKFICEFTGYMGAINAYMIYLLLGRIDENITTHIKDVLCQENMIVGKHSYNNHILELIECKAIKLKQPRLLFENLIECQDIADLQYGLTRLGFNIIECH